MTEAIESPPAPVPVAPPPAPAASAPPPSAEAQVSASPADRPVPAEAPPARWHTLWLTDRDVAVFVVLGAVVLGLLVVRWGRLSGWGAEPVEIERLTPLEYDFRLDLNTATWVEFAQLPGVGETLAIRIVEHREVNGPFRSVDDLDRVQGIGPKTVERLRPFLDIGGEE